VHVHAKVLDGWALSSVALKPKMKRQGFIKNKVMVQLVVININKVNQIPHIDVIPPTFEGDDGYGVLEGVKTTPS
jgi:hypothetical protein